MEKNTESSVHGDRAPVILHLTDLHFGFEQSHSAFVRRELVLDSLASVINKLPQEWRPTIVAISGDIAWQGATSDYLLAAKWLKQFLKEMTITRSNLIVCPGNHDVDRTSAEAFIRPENAEDADRVLGFSSLPPAYLVKSFAAYNDFCKLLRISPLHLGTDESHLVGARQIDGVKFVCLNTAFFSQGHDKGKLWLGLPYLHLMESSGQLPLLAENQSTVPTIALFHHPREFLNESDIHVPAEKGRQASLDYLAHRTHAMLCGHVHSAPQRPDKIAGLSHNFVGGATYASSEYSNNIRLIRVEEEAFICRSLSATPSSSIQRWQVQDVQRLHFAAELPPRLTTGSSVSFVSLREAASDHARRMIEIKSRQIKPGGVLPELTQLAVEVLPAYTSSSQKVDSHIQLQESSLIGVPFSEAAQSSRRCLLLGDLGSGKSTTLGLYAIQSMKSNEGRLALTVAVKNLNLPRKLSVVNLLDSVSEYMTSNIIPSLISDRFSLRDMLIAGSEILLILDGLEELARDTTHRLVQVASSLTEHWPTIQVITSARPVEIAGLNYSKWQVLRCISIQGDVRRTILLNEALADKKNLSDAEGEVVRLLAVLRDRPSLDILANTPLAVRLLYPQLTSALPDEGISLGDLLHSLLFEKLTGWAEKDDKLSETTMFTSLCPDGRSRAIALGCLAFNACDEGSLSADRARILLEEYAKTLTCPNPNLFANSAMHCFEQSGIVVTSQDIIFPLQPLQEAAAGYWIFYSWCNSIRTKPPSPKQWRAVSFAAAALRRMEDYSFAIDPLTSFLDSILVDLWGIPAACIIASELRDKEVACRIVECFKTLGYRPLVWRYKERIESVQAIANTLFLAGDIGFDWFFSEYLDPKFPIINASSAIIQAIFWAWALLVRNTLNTKQIEKLTSLVDPIKAASSIGTFGFDKALALLVPAGFTDNELLWIYSRLFNTAGIGKESERIFEIALEGDNASIAKNILLQHPGNRNYGTLLWLRLNPSHTPTYSIMRNLLLGAASSTEFSVFRKTIAAYRQDIEEDQWRASLRWTLGDSDKIVAAYAAIELHRAGEVSLELIGLALWEGLSEGGYIPEVEETLLKVVQNEGPAGVTWLIRRFKQYRKSLFGTSSACWRILLKTIGLLSESRFKQLASCTANVDSSLITRNPDVRYSIRQLIMGQDGQHYREKLKEELSSPRPASRQGAAMLLICADPDIDVEALSTAVRALSSDRHFHASEWESYLLTLRYGHATLTFLRKDLDSLTPRQRVIALVILAVNNIPLGEIEKTELILGVCPFSERHLITESLRSDYIATPIALLTLLTEMKKPASDKSSYIADALLKFHLDLLSPSDTARCKALCSSEYLIDDFLRENAEGNPTKPEILVNLEKACIKLEKEGAERRTLLAFVKVLMKPTDWKDALWALFCGNTNQIDDKGESILILGRRFPEHSALIGAAAKDLLADPRLHDAHMGESYRWLALLAHEFNSLSDIEIEKILTTNSSIRCCATYSLIARLGRVPASFHRKPMVTDIPEDVMRVSTDKLEMGMEKSLMEVARSSYKLHPSTCKCMEKAIWGGKVGEVQLNQVAATGDNGLLIAGVLRFCMGFNPKADEAIELLKADNNMQMRENTCHNKLLKLGILSNLSRIRMDSDYRDLYLQQLDQNLRTGTTHKHLVLYELLAFRKKLLYSQISLAFDYLVSTHVLDAALSKLLVDWLITEQDPNIKTQVVRSAQIAINQLNLRAWQHENGQFSPAIVFLMFPLIIWMSDQPASDQSISVYLRGLKHLFSGKPNPSYSIPIGTTISIIEPLLLRVSTSKLTEAMEIGYHSHDPAVRAWCCLIRKIAGNG